MRNQKLKLIKLDSSLWDTWYGLKILVYHLLLLLSWINKQCSRGFSSWIIQSKEKMQNYSPQEKKNCTPRIENGYGVWSLQSRLWCWKVGRAKLVLTWKTTNSIRKGCLNHYENNLFVYSTAVGSWYDVPQSHGLYMCIVLKNQNLRSTKKNNWLQKSKKKVKKTKRERKVNVILLVGYQIPSYLQKSGPLVRPFKDFWTQ